MKVIQAGVTYLAETVGKNADKEGIEISFITKLTKKQVIENTPLEDRPKVEGSYAFVKDDDIVEEASGTTNEELIKIVIHRIGVLNRKKNRPENSKAVEKLREGIFWLEEGNKNRSARAAMEKNS